MNETKFFGAQTNGQFSSIYSTKQLPFYMGISEVLPTLYLCGACAIARTEVLEKLDVKLVVNATVELPDTPLPDDKPNYLRVSIKDTKEAKLIEYFDTVADLIEQVSSKKLQNYEFSLSITNSSSFTDPTSRWQKFGALCSRCKPFSIISARIFNEVRRHDLEKCIPTRAKRKTSDSTKFGLFQTTDSVRRKTIR